MDTNLIIAFSIMAVLIIGLLAIVITMAVKNNKTRLDYSFQEDRTVALAESQINDQYKTVPLDMKSVEKTVQPLNDATVALNSQLKIPRLSDEEKTQMLNPVPNRSTGDETQLLGAETAKFVPKAQIKYLDNGVSSIFNIQSEIVTVGRDPQLADFIISDDTFVGREHAIILYRNGCFNIIDLNSRNGTSVDGESIKGIKKLSNKSNLKLGKTEMEFNCN